MKYYKLKYKNGSQDIVKAENALALVKKYDLATVKHINTRMFELEGEQLAIAISNDND
jgi:hypothetical protein